MNSMIKGNLGSSILNFKWLVRIVSLILFISVWEIVGLNSNALLIPTPVSVVQAFVQITVSGLLPKELSETLWTFFLGFVIGSLAGIVIGAFMARFKVAENILDPYVNALYATPYVALVPLFIIWLGIGFSSRLAVVILSVIFVVIINTFTGIQDVNKTLVETGRSFGFSGLPLYRKVVFPASLPYIIAGLRLGIARGLIGAIVAELFLQLVGLGYLLEYFASIFQVANVIAIVLVIALIGLILTEALKYAERRVAKWRVSTTEQ